MLFKPTGKLWDKLFGKKPQAETPQDPTVE